MVLVVFTLFYALSDAVYRDDPSSSDGRTVTHLPSDLLTYGVNAMLAPGQYPDGFHPANEIVQLITLTQSYFGLFLIGLLGFVAGNRIRR